MILSMTGFASREVSTPTGALVIELRSVNHRYLELQLKMDDNLRVLEPQVRELIQAKLGRGKVDCRINLRNDGSNLENISLNTPTVAQIAQTLQTLQVHFPNAQPINLVQVLNMPGIMQTQTVDQEALANTLKQALNQVLDDMLSARAREGEKLKQVILDRLTEIRAQVKIVKPLLPELIKQYQQKLTAKLQEVMLADDERVRQEIVLYAQKIDVDEELERLNAHVQEVERILAAGGQVGKKLDFLMQELNREANTLGSKSVAIETTQVSMQLKVLIEQMREQIQNIE